METAYKFNFVTLNYDTNPLIRNANPEIFPAVAHLPEIIYLPQIWSIFDV